MVKIGFVKGIGVWYERELNTIRKKDDLYLQPIFEAFTNALESIAILKSRHNVDENGKISIKVFLSKDLFSDNSGMFNLSKIEVEDSGIGFEDIEFERFINLRDDRKGFLNKGTGRIQFLHSFDKTTIESNFRDTNSKTGFKYRKIILSKSETFISQNAILKLEKQEEVTTNESYTKVIFENLLSDKDKNYFKSITAEEIKKELIRHYLAGFCEKREYLPIITIQLFIKDVEDKIPEKLEIQSNDIPTPNKDKDIDIYFSKVDRNEIIKSSKKEVFNLKSFIIPESELQSNGLKLVSKGEIATDINLNYLLPSDTINGNRYLFLLSSNYIDSRDSDARGNINLCNKRDFKKNAGSYIYETEEILLEDIEEKVNEVIVSLHKEIEEKSNEKDNSIEELEKMFLLNPQTIKSLRNKIKIGDSDNDILRKIYKADAETTASIDAKIKQQVKKLESLDSTDIGYQFNLEKIVNEVVRIIPLQNKTALTQYVARRKMILDLLDKILGRELQIQLKKENYDEALIHNLLFQKGSTNTETSDLWIINEDFIYFKGSSERQLRLLEIDGKRVFKESFSDEEERYITSLGENRIIKRPDVLLFPEEGKCIIIEFKAPHVNASIHLTQIDTYANLILNYTEDQFNISTFYGYLLGESIETRDVRGAVSTFEESYQFDYLFRPSAKVVGFGRKDGSIYTEVIKYSTLLERAKLRNKIFIDKLK